MTQVNIDVEMNLTIHGMYSCHPPVSKYVVPGDGRTNQEVERELAQMIADSNPSCDFEMDEFNALEVPTEENTDSRVFWVWVD